MADQEMVEVQAEPRPTGVPAAFTRGGGKMGVAVMQDEVSRLVPLLKIWQPLNITAALARSGVIAGQYRFGNKNYDALSVVFLRVDHMRHYDVQTTPGEMPRTLCASANGLVPLPEVRNPPSDRCRWFDDGIEEEMFCPKATWRQAGDKKARDCRPGFAFLGIVPELNGAGFWMVTQKSATRNAFAFRKAFLQDPHVSYLHEWKVRLATEEKEQEKGGGRWYVPVFEVERTLPSDLYMPAFEAAQRIAYKPFLSRALAGEGEEPPDHSDVPDPADEDIPF